MLKEGREEGKDKKKQEGREEQMKRSGRVLHKITMDIKEE